MSLTFTSIAVASLLWSCPQTGPAGGGPTIAGLQGGAPTAPQPNTRSYSGPPSASGGATQQDRGPEWEALRRERDELRRRADELDRRMHEIAGPCPTGDNGPQGASEGPAPGPAQGGPMQGGPPQGGPPQGMGGGFGPTQGPNGGFGPPQGPGGNFGPQQGPGTGFGPPNRRGPGMGPDPRMGPGRGQGGRRQGMGPAPGQGMGPAPGPNMRNRQGRGRMMPPPPPLPPLPPELPNDAPRRRPAPPRQEWR